MSGGVIKNIGGQRFGLLTVISFARVENHTAHWNCICDCGVEVVTRGSHLRSGQTRSCGCLILATATKHGQYKSREYRTWASMIARCESETSASYPDYGGRGIRVCAQWRDSFETFLADMGKRPPGTSIDRIDNDGGYSPDNCRWATPSQQIRNQRRSKISIADESVIAAMSAAGVRAMDIAAKLNVRPNTISQCLRRMRNHAAQ